MPIKLRVNSVDATVDVPEDTPLLWVLRDVLNYEGPKYGCGIGQWGACTVHLKGDATRSCITTVGSVGDRFSSRATLSANRDNSDSCAASDLVR